jgi:phosphatidylserine/phosphatidylglycerophosphate/cardiolipin synthase-like enzyme
MYLDWLDKAYLLKGPIVDDTQAKFDELWNFARSQFKLYDDGKDWRRKKAHPRVADPLKLSPAQAESLAGLKTWVSTPSGAGACALAGEPPMRIRLLHNNLVEQIHAMRQARHSVSRKARLAGVRDAILDTLVEKLSDHAVREADLTSMAFLFHPKLKEALVAAQKRGTQVKLFTDSYAAADTKTPLALNFECSRPGLLELLDQGARVFTLTPYFPVNKSPYNYIHEKLAVFDDEVIFGSHNFNIPSSLYNDEVSFEVRGAAFARKMSGHFYQDVSIAGIPLKADQVRSWISGDLLRNLKPALCNFLMPLF